MRRWIVQVAMLFALATSAAASNVTQEPERALFVGNSLVYVGNLPATFAAMSQANGQPVHSQMIVKGGARLNERLADGAVHGALNTERPAILVLQEQGGALLCWPDKQACVQSQAALKALAQAGRDSGTRVFLLGSYQSHPRASAELVKQEAAAAAQAGIPYVEISEVLRSASTAAPELPWFATDGMHPGPALTLLDAVQLHRAVHGRYPERGFTVDAPIYGTKSGLDATLRDANAPAPLSDTPTRITYSDAEVQRITAMLQATPR
ncbi:hypothetical protein [Stenotrophomonas sp. SY1]|uniref:hypothetical protein n=1 Tax=Stenotrophomonas sp. SY1 TaxID=477235 RepID=UPI001E383952|nr:hypothetical protein [Stenotrophomonas sp. SY1]MCD9087729.1 hypothetical protein [Stenotrophomonas sp. SY1]